MILTGGLILGGFAWMNWDNGIGQANAAPLEKKERHPHIHRAINELREARKELKEAAHDFDGHRVEAVEAVDVAIKQLQVALKYDRK
jgi:hypothetical protein